MENQFEERLRFFVDEFEKILNEYLGGLQLKPDVLNESVRYSLQVGGKRVRPRSCSRPRRCWVERSQMCRTLRSRWN